MEILAALVALGLYGAGIVKVLKEDPPPKPMDGTNREDPEDADGLVVPDPEEMGRIFEETLNSEEGHSDGE
jgi:hypothetical protein